jgi:hypothetical protein
MSGRAGEVMMAAVGLIANSSAGNIRDGHGDADCVLVDLNEQSIGMNHQATADQFAIISAGVLIIPMSKKMPKEDMGSPLRVANRQRSSASLPPSASN